MCVSAKSLMWIMTLKPLSGNKHQILNYLKQVRARSAKGRWVIRDLAEERQAIIEFASFMVFHVLQENALYRLEQDKENND